MAYSIVALTASLVAAWGAVRDADWSRHVTSGVLCVHAGAFIPGLAVDPVLAGFVVVWQLVELGVHLIDRRAADRRRRVRRTQTSADIDDWYRVWGPSTRHLLLTAVVLTVAVVGYGVTNRPTAIATCAAINVVAFAVSMRFLWMLFRAGNWPVLAVGVPWSVLVAAGPSVDGALIAAAVANALAFGFLLVRSPLFDDLLAYFFD
ncbi:MAG: hypothetical protein ABEL76_12495, partial [Bradymonadaceae bacterium]